MASDAKKPVEEPAAPKITRDMIIGDIIDSFPDKAMEIAEIMMSFGIHCIGCGAATFETLEQGVRGHGFTDDDIETLLGELNKVAESSSTPSDKEAPTGPPVKLSDTAMEKVKLIMEQEKQDGGLRVGVKAGGCAGYSYNLTVEKEPQDGDICYKQDDLNIFIDKESEPHLRGTVIDYVDTLNESGFKFNNPNAKSSCGCGSSFS